MRTVEVRRHSKRESGESSLSTEGVALARAIGATMARPGFVITSALPRAVETANAFGYEVDQTFPVDEASWGGIPWGNWLSWAHPFAEAAAAMREAPDARAAGDAALRVMLDAIERVPDGGRALVVSHGGIIELGLVLARPGDDHASWGPVVAECEGAELEHDGTRFTGVRLLRL